jgi:hypothetical protein
MEKKLALRDIPGNMWLCLLSMLSPKRYQEVIQMRNREGLSMKQTLPDSEGFTDVFLRILKHIWRNGVIIFLMLLPVLLLIKMDQGEDLIRNLLEDHGKGGLQQAIVRIFWFFNVLVISSYSIWAIPRFFLDYENPEIGYKGRFSASNILNSTSSDFLRVLAVLPFLFYGGAFIWVVKVTNFSAVPYFLINALLGLVILFGFCQVMKRNIGIRSILIFLWSWVAFSAILFTLSLSYLNDYYEIAYAVMGNGLLITALSVYAAFYKWEAMFEEGAEQEKQRLGKIGDRVYKGGIIVFIFGVAVAMFWPNAMRMSTIPIMVFLLSAYIFGINYLSYRFKVFTARGKILFFLLLVVLSFWLTKWPSRAHHTYLVNQADIPQRIAFEDYARQWLDDRMAIQDSAANVPYPIYLVAGEGGGSRAGYWFLKTLTDLDKSEGYEFSEHVLALSTVSGSSVGSSAWLKWLRFRDAAPLPPSQLDNINDKLPLLMFKNNFVSGSIINLLTWDVLTAFWPGNLRSGRNLRLQKEENTAFICALNQEGVTIEQTRKSLYGTEPAIELWMMDENGKKLDPIMIPNYHFLPLQAVNMDDNGNYVTQYPLAIYNTTHMATGNKRIVAPVILSDTFSDFSNADLIKEFTERNPALKDKAISLGTANNLSELFPVFSAFTYVDGVGNVMDGGGYDNSGMSTLLEIYQVVSDVLQDSVYQGRFTLKVIELENGNQPTAESLTALRDPKLQIPSMLSQASSQPFQTIVPTYRNRAERMIPDSNYIRISLSYYVDKYFDHQSGDSIPYSNPLARDLSSVSLDRMTKASKPALDTLKKWVGNK